MKTLVITVATLFLLGNAQAQKIKESEVPANVKEAFAKKYPGIKAEEWEKEGLDFEAEFDMNKGEYSAVFDANGMFKEEEQEIKITDLPKGIAAFCEKEFAGYKISEAARIVDASNVVTYEAELKKGKEEFDAIFDDQGKFIKRSGAENDGDGED